MDDFFNDKYPSIKLIETLLKKNLKLLTVIVFRAFQQIPQKNINRKDMYLVHFERLHCMP